MPRIYLVSMRNHIPAHSGNRVVVMILSPYCQHINKGRVKHLSAFLPLLPHTCGLLAAGVVALSIGYGKMVYS